MTSQTLRDARRYEDAMAQNITPEERPEFQLYGRMAYTSGKYSSIFIYRFKQLEKNWERNEWWYSISHYCWNSGSGYLGI